MRSCFSWRAVAIAFAVLFSAGPTAHAQQDASAAGSPGPAVGREGHGIRLGDFELHPGIASDVGWTDNVFLEAPRDTRPSTDPNHYSESPDASALLRVSPHLHLSTLTSERVAENLGESDSQKVQFRFGFTGTFKQYFATALKDHPNMGVGQDARLTLRPGSVFQFELFDDFHRTIDPFTQAIVPTSTGTTSADFSRDQLGVGTRLQLSTPGRLFRVGAGYRFDVDHFEDDIFKDNRNRSHTVSTDTSWEFLPKTALFWNGSIRFFEYANPNQPSLVSRSDSRNVQSKIGINGALTPKLGFTIAAGYGAGFLDNHNDYESFIAQVEARWKLRETMLWSLGYDREYNPSFQGDFARVDRIKTRLQALLVNKLLVSLRGELSWINFGTDPVLMTTRDDMHLLTDLTLEYRVVSWFAFTGEAGWIQNFTSFVYSAPATATTSAVNDPAKYHQFQAFLGVRAFL